MTSTAQARTDLRSGHDGVASGSDGLTSVSALKTVLTSWEKRLAAVQDECDSLEPKLHRVAKELGEVDAKVGAKGDAIILPDSRRER
ncbi:hypothetical protein [Streptomyces sp. NRRL S-1521]|uniref:hypothetical protein n=1 Tax=Streptomyces sp. NRRL S-1521 TaxID=1609100 RepID=UPI00131E2A8E|nr:hypothetical protein [Streptomyces sp. NRRL S-1521]